MKRRQKQGGMFSFSSLFSTQTQDKKSVQNMLPEDEKTVQNILNDIVFLANQNRSVFGEQKRFKVEFAEFDESNIIPNWNTMNWKELIGELIALGNEQCSQEFNCRDFANEIQNFRNDFMLFITKHACNKEFQSCKTSCLSSGSEDLTSDIDVTVKGDCIKTNLLVLMAIRRFISEQYLNFHPFNGNLHNISKFFDVNFYLSNFAILKSKEVDDNVLESYYLTNDFKSQLSRINENETNMKKVTTHFNDYITIVEKTSQIHIELKQNPTQINENKFIDMISHLALYEDECYVTQGAFIHVVYMTQKKKPFHHTLNDRTMKIFLDFMICSILENLYFSISHPGKSRGKYLMRVLDAEHNRRLLLNKPDEISQTLKLINDGIIDNDVKILHEYRYSLNLNKNELSKKEDIVKGALMNVETQLVEQVYKKIKEILLTMVSQFDGGRYMIVKKLVDKSNKTVKKEVNGKECVIYIDNKRCQYVKKNNKYVPLNEARKAPKSSSRANKK